jgi:hypothetical protein
MHASLAWVSHWQIFRRFSCVVSWNLILQPWWTKQIPVREYFKKKEVLVGLLPQCPKAVSQQH